MGQKKSMEPSGRESRQSDIRNVDVVGAKSQQ